MKDIIKKLELAETELTGEPSEENAAEALLLIKDVLQVLRQTDVSGSCCPACDSENTGVVSVPVNTCIDCGCTWQHEPLTRISPQQVYK